MKALSVLEVNSNQLHGSLPDTWGRNGSFPLLRIMNLVQHLGSPKHALLTLPVNNDVIYQACCPTLLSCMIGV